MSPSLLDTDILSEVHKQKNPQVVLKAAAYLQAHQQFSFSAFTRYGEKKGVGSLFRGVAFLMSRKRLPTPFLIFDRAADMWAVTHQAGRPQKDADLTIAATALEHGLMLITGNTSHFSWIHGLTIED